MVLVVDTDNTDGNDVIPTLSEVSSSDDHGNDNNINNGAAGGAASSESNGDINNNERALNENNNQGEAQNDQMEQNETKLQTEETRLTTLLGQTAPSVINTLNNNFDNIETPKKCNCIELTTVVEPCKKSDAIDSLKQSKSFANANDGNQSSQIISSTNNSLTNYFSITEGSQSIDWQMDDKLHSNSKEEEDHSTDTLKRENISSHLSGDNLSAVICLEEGLADNDSWVEELDRDDFSIDQMSEDEYDQNDDDEDNENNDNDMGDDNDDEFLQLDNVRPYSRCDIDFTLHTIVEESGEESDTGPDDGNPTKLEKYFSGIGYGNNDGNANLLDRSSSRNIEFDSVSAESDLTTSTISEDLESGGLNDEEVQILTAENNSTDLATATSRLEKYFLIEFLGFNKRDSDGSVGSDSEGKRSPTQRRKKLLRARGSRHGSSTDILNEESQTMDGESPSSDSSTSDCNLDDENNLWEKTDSHCDTMKRRKKNKRSPGVGVLTTTISSHENSEANETAKKESFEERTAIVTVGSDANLETTKPQFVSDLDNFEKVTSNMTEEQVTVTTNGTLTEIVTAKMKTAPSSQISGLSRKDSFNNWSSDEETNLMMSKMRTFFKSMIATQRKNASPPLPAKNNRNKPPQLVYFESELTRLMETVPGIRDDQVKEIVEYLSSEDTWSDSYDSSDYTSSDLEAAAATKKNTFYGNQSDTGKKGLKDSPDTMLDYLMRATNNSDLSLLSTTNNSPPLMNKVMQHIGSRLVALMHQVSEGSTSATVGPTTTAATSSVALPPKAATRYHRRSVPKLPPMNTTEEEDDSTEECSPLPRSKSYDPLLDECRQETSDNERFSWRGSFESALMTSADSRTRLPSIGENSASTLALAVAKRRSAGDLLVRTGISSSGPGSGTNSREHLDRVRSCGSIGGIFEDKIWTSRHATRKRRSSMPDGGGISVGGEGSGSNSGESADGENDSDDEDEYDHKKDADSEDLVEHECVQPHTNYEDRALIENVNRSTTLPRTLMQKLNSTTNSLPRLVSAYKNNAIAATAVSVSSGNCYSPSTLIMPSHLHHLGPPVKSARYRPPGYSNNLGVGVNNNSPFHTSSSLPKGLNMTHVPPRREFNRRRARPIHTQTLPLIGNTCIGSSVVLHTPIIGLGDDCSVSSDISEQIGSAISDGSKFEKSHSRLSTISVSRSDSMISVYSGAGEGRYGVVPVRGEVEFGLQYNYKTGDVEIHVKRCCDLAPVDMKRNRSDPYVKVYLLPDKSKSGKRKTRIKKHTLNPIFDEILKYHISLEDLKSKTIWLSVWHSDMFGRNDFLGEIMLPLEDKVFDDPSPKLYVLKERSEMLSANNMCNLKGEIIIALKFSISVETKSFKNRSSLRSVETGVLHVLVKEAKNLLAVKSNGSSDPFCKSYLLPNKGRNCKQKTPIVKKSCHPIWNHTFVYDNVTLEEISQRCLELTVWDHDRLSSNEFLGGVRLSLGTGFYRDKLVDWMDSNSREAALWQRMIEHPNFWVESSLILRPSLDVRSRTKE